MKQVQTEDVRTWIVVLRNVHTGQQQLFSNLNGLIQFLQTEFGNIEIQNDTGQIQSQDVQIFPAQ